MFEKRDGKSSESEERAGENGCKPDANRTQIGCESDEQGARGRDGGMVRRPGNPRDSSIFEHFCPCSDRV